MENIERRGAAMTRREVIMKVLARQLTLYLQIGAIR
jgi:hypothetical protein